MTATGKSSRDNPIRVGWVPTAFSGKLGITIAPGKHDWSSEAQRDLAADLDRLAGELGVEVLVCLLEDDELRRLRIPNLVPEAERRGMTVHRLPIPDGSVLPSTEPIEKLLLIVTEALEVGRTVVVHCAGGLGRSGTIVGCFLRHHGASPEEALVALVKARGRHCPETEEQKDFIRSYSPRVEAPDPFLGAVLGAAIGDAMGHPTEFIGSFEQIREKYGPSGVTSFTLYWERDGRRFAPYTDDTQMAEVVLRTLVDGQKANLDLDATMTLMGQRFVAWNEAPQGGHRAPGNACREGCRQLAAGAHWSEAGGERAGGCGSVMRAYPFGLMFAHDLERAEAWAVAHSKLTHRDPIALAACAAMAVGVGRIVRRDPLNVVTSEMVAAAGRYSSKTASMMAQALSDVEGGVEPEVTLNRLQAWAAHEAIAAGLYIFARHPHDLRAAILEGANTPGDSDSIASIAGALVGARCGVVGLPETWVQELERSRELRDLAREASTVAREGLLRRVSFGDGPRDEPASSR